MLVRKWLDEGRMIGVTLGSGFAYILGGAVVALVEDMDALEVPVLGQMHGWQLTFFIVGLPGLLVALWMRATVREPARKGLGAEPSGSIPLREVVAYIVERRTAYGYHIFGVSIYIMVVYALNLWGPSYFIRTFDYGRAEAGLTFGILMILAGTAGLLVAGFGADRWFARGRLDAYPRTILISMVCMIPCAGMLGIVTNDLLGIVFMSLAVFLSAVQGGIAGGTLQLMSPNRMRGQIMAVYLLVGNLIGLGLGPTVVAATTDYVFGYDAAVGKSIALCAVVICPIGAAILWRGLGPVRAQIAERQALDDAGGGRRD